MINTYARFLLVPGLILIQWGCSSESPSPAEITVSTQVENGNDSMEPGDALSGGMGADGKNERTPKEIVDVDASGESNDEVNADDTWKNDSSDSTETQEGADVPETIEEDGESVTATGDANTSGEIDWFEVEAFIDSKSALNNATVMIGDSTGTLFSYSRGESKADTRYAIASASKLLMALTTLRLVENGELSLDSTPAGLLPFWTTDEGDPRSKITLEQLLSFTSGFSGNSGLNPEEEVISCVEDQEVSTAACAEEIYGLAFEFSPPGSTFFYGPAHMYVAAAMALEVRPEFTWNKVFRNEIGNPLNLDSLSGFLAPSPLNGRPGGGVLMSARDYATILTALLAGELLSQESVSMLSADRTPSSTVTLMNPPPAASEGEWHYALGCWRECPGIYAEENCDAPGVISSPGAFGFYPWWDQKHEIWGIVALQYPVPSGASVTVPIGAEIRNMAVNLLFGP